jgi:hypothetical protein
MSISIEQIGRFVYAAVIVSLIIDIGGAFGLKYAASAMLLLWVLVLFIKVGVRRDLAIEFGLVLYFAFSVCYSLFSGIELADIYGQLSFLVYFALLFVALYIPRNAAADIFRRTMVFGSLIVIGTFLVILFFPVTLFVWKLLSETYRLGYLGEQNIAGHLLPNIYYRWSMWLIPGFLLSIGKHPISSVLIGAAALITLSTSVIVFTLLGTGILFFVMRNHYSISLKGLAYTGALGVAALLVLELNFSVFQLVYENVISKLSANSFSTSVKLGHIDGALQSMQASFSSILFGTGVGSEFYSPGIRDYAINIEVSHFNFVRQFGLIGGALFFGYVAYVVVTAFVTDALGRRWAIGLLMLFCAAGTNPLLMSPVFIVVLVTVRSYVARFGEERANE